MDDAARDRGWCEARLQALEQEIHLLQADLADIAIEYRQQLDVGQAIIERAASPDMLLH